MTEGYAGSATRDSDGCGEADKTGTGLAEGDSAGRQASLKNPGPSTQGNTSPNDLAAAIEDALSGWRYIRHMHGDLYGVGWDRVEQRLTAVLTTLRSRIPAPIAEDEVERVALVNAVRMAEAIFDEYARLHRAKGDQAGDAKAMRNEGYANDMRAALAAIRTTPGDAWQPIETFETINEWCDDTFGTATIPQIIERAKEEFAELEEPDADHAIEAADVVICLCRVPGFAAALQAKMAINRKRKWRLVGNGTGYHIPDSPAQPSEGSTNG